MSDAETQALLQTCRETFGREFTEAELQFFGARLKRQVAALERLRELESGLGLTEPAVVSALFRSRQP